MGFERENGAIRQRSTALLAAYAAVAVGLYVPVLYLFRASLPGGLAAALVYFGSLFGMGYAWQRTWKNASGRITADARGLFLNERCVVGRERLRHAYVLRAGGKTYLRLVRLGALARPIDVVVDGEDEARAILAALRLDAQSSVAEHDFTDGTPKNDRQRLFLIAGYFLSLAVMAIALIFKHVRPEIELVARSVGVFMALFGAASAMFMLHSRNVSVSVGADGIRLRQLGIPARFIAFRDLERVTRNGGEITLELRDRTTVSVHHVTEGRVDIGYDREGEAAGLEARIREAHAAYRATPSLTATALDRGGRTTDEWIAHARGLREDAATYRDAKLPDEQLWHIVEDASASATERAGAALALRNDLDDAGRQRLRIAAEACAEKHLRVALETATGEDERALASALEELGEAPLRRMTGMLRS